MLFGKKHARTISVLEAILKEREDTIRSLQRQVDVLSDLAERQSIKLQMLERAGYGAAPQDGGD